MKKALIALALVLVATTAWAAREHPERYYQQAWCVQQDGQMEVVLPDGSRCDCETATHMVEFDFGKKWAESIGQALNYARQAPGKRAGVVLIVAPDEDHYVERVRKVAESFSLPLDVFTVPK